ncbi:Neuronal PAS domain-containing protein 3 [Triplophysa tibetana]|uniref:Neuronal PAS domain-containing protein 1 n=1 Tax=Triplophysa tibetana TaxID=1572043 RepID=A0A5A9N1E5_9TELE|nr:Neuronal PAS domain-containing protein 3 [Triplophysa tibetana]
MAAMPFVSEGKCVSVEWDFLQGLLAKPPTLPCLQNLRKEKSRNAARSRRGKENFEFFELAKMLPLPGAITSQLDKASIIRLTISYLHMRHFASQGDPPWSPLMEGQNNCNKGLFITFKMLTGGSHGNCEKRSDLGCKLLCERDNLESHLFVKTVIDFTAIRATEAHTRTETTCCVRSESQRGFNGSLDGFVFVVSQEGRFLYISETVSIYLGLSQVELTGSSVFDYIHPADHVEMADRLGIRPHLRAEAGCQTSHESASSSASTPSMAGTPEPGIFMMYVAPSSPCSPANELSERGFFIRMKSTLTKRGLHIKSSGYKVIHVTGRIRCRPALVPCTSRPLHRPMGLVALAHTLPPSTLNEVRMESHMFVFRVNMDLQVTYCENRISEYMDLSPADVVGQTCYHFVYVEDLDTIRQSHEDLLRKGQVVTGYYRWLQRRGGYLWIQSCATVSINHKAPHERNVIWVNYVVRHKVFSEPEAVNLFWSDILHYVTLSVFFPGSTVMQPIKSSAARAEPDRKGKETYAHSVSSQSEETRKRSQHPNSDSGPPESRRRVEVFRQREDSPCTSSDQASDSEVEEEDERETQWDHASSGKHVKNEDGTAKQGNGKIHNGRAVIQHLKSVVTSSASNIKTEQEVMGTNSGGRWGQPPSGGGTNGSSPPSKSTPTEAPPKGLFNPPSPTLSPPVSATPLARDDRSIHGGRASDFELLQRLTASGAAGRVLFHPLALGPQGPQSLYAPSTIRYAPAEMPAGHAEVSRVK